MENEKQLFIRFQKEKGGFLLLQNLGERMLGLIPGMLTSSKKGKEEEI